MSEIEFEKAAEDVKNLNTKPNDEELLEVYSLFKQAKEGDVITTCPGIFQPREKAKWNAWNGKKGVSKEDARQAYVNKVQELIAKYGLAK